MVRRKIVLTESTELLFVRYDNRCRHLQPNQVRDKLAQGVPHVIRFRLETGVEPFQDMIFGWNRHDVAQVRTVPMSHYTYIVMFGNLKSTFSLFFLG